VLPAFQVAEVPGSFYAARVDTVGRVAVALQIAVTVILLAGLVIIQVWTFFGRALDIGGGPLKFFSVLLVFLGLLFQYLAWTVGFGAFLLTRFGTQSGWYPRRGLPLSTAPPPEALPAPEPAPRPPEAPSEGDSSAG